MKSTFQPTMFFNFRGMWEAMKTNFRHKFLLKNPRTGVTFYLQTFDDIQGHLEHLYNNGSLDTLYDARFYELPEE
jgi:hypothetical protein